MKEDIGTIATLHNLLDYDSRKFTSIEAQLKKILPEWIDRAHSMGFKTVLRKYEGFVLQHINEMELFYKEEGIDSLIVANEVMEAFIKEANEKVALCSDAEVKDACLLAVVQAINHYKISMYGTAAAFAKALGNEKFAAVFHEAEINEKQIDDRLSQLAEFEINNLAKAPIVLPGNN